MTVFWGAWEYAGGNGMQVGCETYNITSVTTSSTTYSVTIDVWTGNQYNYSGDGQTITWSGSGNGSINYTNGQATGTQTKRHTITTTYTYPAGSYGTSPGTMRTDFTVSGAYNGVTPTQYSSLPIPARPYAAPNAPTGVTTARSSDTKTTVSWISPATAQRPVTNYTLQLSTYTGSTWGAWTNYYTGTATSVAVTTSANHVYKYQVKANNSVGSSAYVAGTGTYTTPSAPTSVAANASGSDIVVTWASGAYVSGTVTHKIERSVDGGAWVPMISGIAQATKTWTDFNPGAANRYWVATSTSGNGGLSSSWVNANEVVLADCWIWDGTVALPAMMTLWNGTTEAPLHVEQQTR